MSASKRSAGPFSARPSMIGDNRDDVVTSAFEHLTNAADSKDWIDGDEWVGRCDYDARRVHQRFEDIIRRARFARPHDVDGRWTFTSWW